jgi:hypothetical protein
MKWNKVSDCLPDHGVPVLAFSSTWIDPDFNPRGIRECFIGGDGDLLSAWWDNDMDNWWCDDKSVPSHWLPFPEPPAAEDCGGAALQPTTAALCNSGFVEENVVGP